MQKRRGLRVLVVGDKQQDFRENTHLRPLEEWGHEVELAHDGA